MDSEDDSPTSEIRQRVEELSEDYVEKLRRGEIESKRQLIESHPDLAPFLEDRLELLEAVYKATLQPKVRRSSADAQTGVHSAPSDNDASIDTSFEVAKIPRALRLRCPHCGNAVQLATKMSASVTCGSCGSVVNVDQDITRADSAGSLPKKIGRFNVIRLLGQGAFGLVYLAKDPELQRHVAIKVPRKGFFSSEEEEQRFFREASSAAQLRHPNIVQVHEISQSGGVPFIVSEYINGLTLKDLVSRGLLTFKEIAQLMVQISDAVHHAHQNGVVHRDLKPANILIDHHRNPYVADFGLARKDDAEITVTLDGTILGTPAYMSPEQAMGEHDFVDARSDVYSLGVVLYRMLSREFPFNGTKRTLLHQVIYEQPSRPSKFNDRIPKDLDTITLKAMQKAAPKRYQSAKELGEELQRWLLGEPIRARPISSMERLGRWCRRHPAIASLTGVILGLLLLSSIGGIIAAKVQHDLRTRSDANAKRATENELESNSRLHQILEQNSLVALHDNRLIDAAHWQAKANEIKDSADKRQRVNLILDRLPKQTNAWVFEGKPTGIQFTNDGTRLATHTDDGFVQVLERRTGEVMCRLPTDLDFSPLFQFVQANIIAIRSANSQVQLWDIESTSLVKQIDFTGLVNSIETNQAQTTIVIGTTKSELVLVDETGEEKRSWAGEDWQILEAGFLPSNEVYCRVNKAGVPGNKIFVWDQQDDEIGVAIESANPIVDSDLSSDGTRLAIADNKGTVQIYDTSNGDKVGESVSLADVARRIYFIDDGNLVAIDRIGNVDRWDVESGNSKSLFDFGKDADSLAFNENRDLIAAAESSGVVRVYWPERGIEVCSAFSRTAKDPAITFAPNGRELAIEGVNNSISVWDLAGSMPSQAIFQHDSSVRNGVFSPDGKRCISAGVDGKVFLIDAEKSQVIDSEIVHEGGVIDCVCSPDGLLFATAGADSTAIVWDCFSGEPVGKPFQHGSAVMTLAFSPDSKKLATGCVDGTVKEWSLESGMGDPKFNFELKHEDRIRRVSYSPSGKYLLSGNLGGTAKCTDVATGLPAFAPCEKHRPLWDCAFLPDEEEIVVCSSNGRAIVWDLAAAAVTDKLNCNADVKRVAISKDAAIVTSDSSGTSRIWTRDDNRYSALTFDSMAIASAYHSSFDAANKICVTAGGKVGESKLFPNSGAVEIWDFATGLKITASIDHDGPVRRVAINESGSRLLTSSTDTTAKLINLTPFEISTEDTILITSSNTQSWTNVNDAPEYGELKLRLPQFFQCEASEIRDWDDRLRQWNNSKHLELE